LQGLLGPSKAVTSAGQMASTHAATPVPSWAFAAVGLTQQGAS